MALMSHKPSSSTLSHEAFRHIFHTVSLAYASLPLYSFPSIFPLTKQIFPFFFFAKQGDVSARNSYFHFKIK